MMTEENKSQSAETKRASSYSYPHIPLAPEVKLWLEAAYARLKKGERINPTEMLVELWGKIPEEFNYKTIDRRLVQFGYITLLGILHVDPTTDFIDKTDQVIRFIRELIRKDPGIVAVTAKQVSEGIGIPETEVAVVFNLIHHLGTFWNGASGDGKVGYTSINIESEEVKREYLGYKGIDHLIDKFYNNNEPKQEAEQIQSNLLKPTILSPLTRISPLSTLYFG